MSDNRAEAEIVYGIHSVQAKVKRKPGDVRRIYVDRSAKKRFGVILKLARQKRIAVEETGATELRAMSGGGAHQGIVARCLVDSAPPGPEQVVGQLASLGHPPVVLVLDRVNDPGNLGACLRSAAAFGVDAVFATVHHSAPLSPVARKAAAGAAECLPVVGVASLRHCLDLLRSSLDVAIVASAVDESADSQPPYQADLRGRGIALVLGGEHGGVRQSVIEQSDMRVQIPMSDKIDCLNVSAACAVLLYEIRRQKSMG